MRASRLMFPAAFLAVLVATGCAAIPQPASDDFEIDYAAFKGKRSCGIAVPPTLTVQEKHIYPNAGGDTVLLKGPARILVFDSASPTTLEVHDSLVLHGANPAAYRFRRVGADLLICGEPYWQEILLVRHYCADDAAEPPWNNRIEEITFPDAGETWLANEIYDALPADKRFPDAERIAGKYNFDKARAKATASSWRVRPFRDVLPWPWNAAMNCDGGSNPRAPD